MPVHRVSVGEIEEALQTASHETKCQLREFATLMIDEVRDRATSLDTKGLAIAGFGAALVAFLLTTSTSRQAAGWLRFAVAVPTIVGTVAVLEAFMATRFKDWDWPSEQDWFRRDLFAHPELLRGYHLMSLLDTYRQHNAINAAKATALRRAQALLVVATVMTALLVVASGFIAPTSSSAASESAVVAPSGSS
jgi:hypothetical protein